MLILSLHFKADTFSTDALQLDTSDTIFTVHSNLILLLPLHLNL